MRLPEEHRRRERRCGMDFQSCTLVPERQASLEGRSQCIEEILALSIARKSSYRGTLEA